jgi:F-type H+-transporting ATPase subunit gamma
MSDTAAGLRRKIDSAGDLQSVVRTMKAMAASSIGQYERSVRALADYYRTVELGLSVCFRGAGSQASMTAQPRQPAAGAVGAVVFGSDQGLVGQFNDVVADFALGALAARPGKPRVWAVGERVHRRLADAGLAPLGLFPVPNSVKAIAPLVGQVLVRLRGAGRATAAAGTSMTTSLAHRALPLIQMLTAAAVAAGRWRNRVPLVFASEQTTRFNRSIVTAC